MFSSDWNLVSTGHVGVPLPCNVVKLVDVEEMNYFASNGEGEVREVTDDALKIETFGTNPDQQHVTLTATRWFLPEHSKRMGGGVLNMVRCIHCRVLQVEFFFSPS